ncbi:MAG: PhzF family phenazine biosynthesis protein [Actinomycetota bacterium]|nr:PhzF family phenazine biosynthesis protein [Actinomycetota bacterium]
MSTELWIVDAFAERPFTGNPAAVAVLASFPADGRMAAIADEVHLSETAFVVPRSDGSHDLRWFTPTVEVDLCGHATLAAAHVLGGRARFHTRSGVLDCRPAGSGLAMDFPADEPVAMAVPDLGLGPVTWSGRGRDDVLVVVEDAHQVRRMVPDLGAMAALGARAVVVTAPGDRPGIDMVSRVFAPNVGVSEDPVTGSAHCALAGYWGPVLGRDELVGEQASARGGTVGMARAGDRVTISGPAVTVGRLELLV